MYQIRVKNRKELIQAAMGKIPNDLKIKNAKIVNVFNGEITSGSIYVKHGFISHVAYEGVDDDLPYNKAYDAQNQYVIPGLIDSHVHIESSMLTPYHFAEMVLPWGTTTVITDPHEIGNVLGVRGVRYMHEISKDLPMRQLIDIPSSVPSVKGGLEYSNAEFYKEEISQLAQLERVIGLAEVMDYLAVINAEDWMIDILETALDNNLYLQAHAPGVTGKALSAYLCGGPRSDHETRLSQEAFEKFRLGMRIDARDSSMAKNVVEILKGIQDTKFYDNFSFCTDDRECDDILKHGHLNDVVNHAISQGMDPVLAIKCATYNAAREAEITNLGAIAPGYAADMIVIKEISHIDPVSVFYAGEHVVQDHQLLVEASHPYADEESLNTVVLKKNLSPSDFDIKAPVENGYVTLNVMAYDDLEGSMTHLEKIKVKVENSHLILPEDLKYVAICNRYGRGNIALHVLKGFGLKKGALGSTVSHDSHNLAIVYDNPEDAYHVAVNIQKAGGGMSAVLQGQTLYTLALPLAGLMSLNKGTEFYQEAEQMKKADRTLGLSQDNPLLRIATIALPVVPEIKMSDVGCIEVNSKTFVPLFALDE